MEVQGTLHMQSMISENFVTLKLYCIADNVSELTARINDEGWDTSFSNWLKVSNLNQKDAIFILSVGGGNLIKNVSVNIINAIKYAKQKNKDIWHC